MLETASTASITAQDIRAPAPVLAVLGYAVFWRLSGMLVPHADLCQALTQAGFGAYAPSLPQPATALRRALLTLAHQAFQETLLLRAISQHPCVLALVSEQPDQQGGLSYVIRLRVRYDPGTQDICCTLAPNGPIDASTEAPQVSAMLRPLFTEVCQTHTGEDLSRVLRAIITDCQAVRLQRGVYFVPGSQSEPLRRLDTLLTTLPGAPLLATLARLDERRTRERLVHAIHADLTRELDGMESRLEQLCAGQPQPDPGVLSQHLVRFRAAQTKAQIYTELLGARVQEIRTRLRHMQERVQDLVLLDINALVP